MQASPYRQDLRCITIPLFWFNRFRGMLLSLLTFASGQPRILEVICSQPLHSSSGISLHT